ncbi:Uncharacterized protein FWK35_00023154 [Aphis craccivora]|uniref:Uncharacterized protein n=1 Tax=Aphis craccivora TaxID=307492 RepID=A0A6G0WLY5_APHCR|nr:Uncharacterized protein FWK35_00023154 [Aphis craccivora]
MGSQRRVPSKNKPLFSRSVITFSSLHRDHQNVTSTTDINLNNSLTIDVVSEDTCKDLCEISKFGSLSSLCWLLDNKIHRVSNDCLRCFMNVTDQNLQVKLKRSIRSNLGSKQHDLLKLCDDNKDDDILLDNVLNDVSEVQYRKPRMTYQVLGTSDMVLAILPESKLIQCKRKFIMNFLGMLIYNRLFLKYMYFFNLNIMSSSLELSYDEEIV